MRPGGNRVESFLDLAAPDDTPMEELVAWARQVLSAWPDPAGFPLSVVEGTTGLRFGCDPTLLGSWDREAFDLLAAIEELSSATGDS